MLSVLSALSSRPEREISISAVYPFLQEGENFSLTDAFPFEWDEVEIANAPGGMGDFYTDLREFDPSFKAWHDMHFLVIFYRDGKVIEYFQYLNVGGNVIFPVFGESHRVELGWHKRIPREKALFFCDGLQDENQDFICTLVPDT